MLAAAEEYFKAETLLHDGDTLGPDKHAMSLRTLSSDDAAGPAAQSAGTTE